MAKEYKNITQSRAITISKKRDRFALNLPAKQVKYLESLLGRELESEIDKLEISFDDADLEWHLKLK